MNVRQFLAITFDKKNDYPRRNYVVCNDGFQVSIQASEYHYCEPRINTKFYNSVELGFPNKVEKLILPYAETSENPTNTVYGWTPIEVIEEVIVKHGGINIDKTFKL
jgi:hypothetical protein